MKKRERKYFIDQAKDIIRSDGNRCPCSCIDCIVFKKIGYIMNCSRTLAIKVAYRYLNEVTNNEIEEKENEKN